MSRAASREDGRVSFDHDLMHESSAFMPEDMIVKEDVRAYKRIVPKRDRSVRIGEQTYSAEHPRVVRSNMKIPANWFLVDNVADGEYLETDSLGDLYHTCLPRFDAIDR